jgi:hypothetical protein
MPTQSVVESFFEHFACLKEYLRRCPGHFVIEECEDPLFMELLENTFVGYQMNTCFPILSSETHFSQGEVNILFVSKVSFTL